MMANGTIASVQPVRPGNSQKTEAADPWQG